jgi:CheY-like chemotaxis protein
MPKFLVVDRDPAAVRAMTRLLHEDGHEVTPFTAGAHAVDALAREPFDAVITDHEMPHVDGEAVAQAARLHAPRACLVVVSARSDAEKLYGVGACLVHAKPLDYDGLVGTVGECRARGGPGEGGACPMNAKGVG